MAISHISLDTPIDPQGNDLTLTEVAAADRLVMNLRRTLVGHGLILVTPSISPAMDQPPFDAVIHFERGEPVIDRRTRRLGALSA